MIVNEEIFLRDQVAAAALTSSYSTLGASSIAPSLLDMPLNSTISKRDNKPFASNPVMSPRNHRTADLVSDSLKQKS
jgi:hypothetical protein